MSGRGCPLQEDARRELEFARGPVFFQEARKALEETNEPKVKRLLERFDARFGKDGVPPVRFVVEGRLPSDPQVAAGVARGSKALFANLEEIPASDWNIVFTHELVHLVDPQLDLAVSKWQDEEFRKDLRTSWEAGTLFLGEALEAIVDGEANTSAKNAGELPQGP